MKGGKKVQFFSNYIGNRWAFVASRQVRKFSDPTDAFVNTMMMVVMSILIQLHPIDATPAEQKTSFANTSESSEAGSLQNLESSTWKLGK